MIASPDYDCEMYLYKQMKKLPTHLLHLLNFEIFIAAVRIVSTTSSKYTKMGQIRFRWKLDLPVVVLKHHGTTNFR